MKEEDLLIGAHTSTAGGAQNALLEGARIGATTVQIFTRNQKQWNGKPYGPDEIALWEATLKETGLREIMSHDSYLINLCNPDPEKLEKSRKAFGEEIERCHAMKLTYLNFHPGAALDGDRQQALDLIADSLLGFEGLFAKGPTLPLLESTAGQGSSIGHRFEELGYIVNRVKDRMEIGVCIDTCHAFVAGYDVRTPEACDLMLKEFDRTVGLKYLRAFHINDSKTDFGSRVDRHADLGEGKIGIECFRFLMTDPRTRKIPKYLETPGGTETWAKEIALLKQFSQVKVCEKK